MVITELIKSRFNQGKQSNVYFWRNNTGNEVDVIVENGNGRVVIEINSAKTISNDFFKSLEFYGKLTPEFPTSYLIYGGEESFQIGNYLILPLENIAEMQIN